jgi:hypothetical protein
MLRTLYMGSVLTWNGQLESDADDIYSKIFILPIFGHSLSQCVIMLNKELFAENAC